MGAASKVLTRHRRDSKLSDVVTKRLEIPLRDALWFERRFPVKGAWTWLIQSTVYQLRQLPEADLEALVERAVKEMAQE